MSRKFLILLLCLFGGFVLLTWQTRPSPAQPKSETNGKSAKPAAPALPISQVILFSSGVGYYQREGEVTGNSRIELTLPSCCSCLTSGGCR